MTEPFAHQIANALGPDMAPGVTTQITDPTDMPAYFDVTGLATASVQAAAMELAALTGARDVTLSQRRALMWFGMTLRPIGWTIPGPWDPIAGDYATADGWIRLHTNAPHHRAAALSVLERAPDRDAVASTVRTWTKTALETAIVAANGAAAAMHSRADWANHPQGATVAKEPLIAWEEVGTDAPPRPLHGLRVLDLTRVLAGPVATRFLAGHGADVLRIDPPDWDEPGVVPEVGLGKRCAALDLRQAEARAQFDTLLETADVLVHGYRPGALAGLGYGSDALRARAPHMIEVTLNAYGWQGPWAGRRGFDSLVQMSSGIAEAGMRKAGADKPVPLPVQALDHATGYLMAAALLRALRVRNATGRCLRARVSLGRTAAALNSAGMRDPVGIMPPESAQDLAPKVEATGWGPANRIAAPVTLDGKPPHWRYPSGPLHRHAAAW